MKLVAVNIFTAMTGRPAIKRILDRIKDAASALITDIEKEFNWDINDF